VTLDGVQREMVAAAAQAGRTAAADLVPSTVGGVVLSVDPTNTVAIVKADGPNEPHGAAVVAPVTLRPGDRVMLLYTGEKPGCIVIGRRSGDYDDWHVVGDEGEPQFVSGWGHTAGTTFPGQNGDAQFMFTMRSGRVELRGRASRTSGSSQAITTMPEYAWPDNDLLLAAQGNLGSQVNITIDMSTGLLSVTSGDICIFDGVSYLARIQQPD
jgi:hypothetical protein